MDAESRPLVDTLRAQSTRFYGNLFVFSAQSTLPYLFFLVVLQTVIACVTSVAAAVMRLFFSRSLFS